MVATFSSLFSWLRFLLLISFLLKEKEEETKGHFNSVLYNAWVHQNHFTHGHFLSLLSFLLSRRFLFLSLPLLVKLPFYKLQVPPFSPQFNIWKLEMLLLHNLTHELRTMKICHLHFTCLLFSLPRGIELILTWFKIVIFCQHFPQEQLWWKCFPSRTLIQVTMIQVYIWALLEPGVHQEKISFTMSILKWFCFMWYCAQCKRLNVIQWPPTNCSHTKCSPMQVE